MSNTQQPEFRTAHAATIATLTAITHDPIDAMRLAADLFAMSTYRAEKAVALEAGATSPRAPAPLSRYVRLFTAEIRTRLSAIARVFTAEELDRLKRLGPAFTRQLERNDPDLAEEIYNLMCMESDQAAAWVRDHLVQIEARFSS